MIGRVRCASPALALAGALALASVGTVQRYLGTGSVGLYLFAMALLVPLLVARGLRMFLRYTSERMALRAALVTLLVLVVAFVVVYPLAQGDVFGGGSDRDEAATLGARNLLHLRFPYDGVTYLGNPISDLPGALLLAAPFALLGTSAYQNLVWLPAFFIVLGLHIRSSRLALAAAWVALIASPSIVREFVTGGDLVPNAVYVLLSMLAVLSASAMPGRRGVWLALAAAGALGVALSSRANYLLVIPLLVSAVFQQHGRGAALRVAATSTAVAGALTLPFYLYDRAGFSPLRTENKFAQFETVLPHAQAIILSAAVGLTVGLAFTRMNDRAGALARNCALVQAFLVVCVLVLASAKAHRPDFTFFSPYGINAVFFALLAAAESWKHLDPTLAREPPTGLRAGQARPNPPPTPLG